MKQIKKKDVAALHELMSASKMTKGDSTAKRALVDAIVATKAEAEKYRDFERITREKLQPEDFKAKQEAAQRSDLTQREIVELNNYFMRYEGEVAKALRDEAAKTVAVDLTPWTQEQYDALLDSNDFTGGQMLMARALLDENKPDKK